MAVFDSLGRFLRTIGGRGDGPGEFGRDRVVRVLVSPEDSIYVFYDPTWVEVFSPSLSYVRRIRMPAYPIGQAAKTKDGFVIRANIASPDRIGMPMHIVASSGKLLKSFAEDSGAVILGQSGRPDVFLAFAIDPGRNSVWLGEESGFVLQEWKLDGQRGSRLVFGKVPWLRPVEYYDTVGPRGQPLRLRRPFAIVSPSHVDDEGWVWLVASIPRRTPSLETMFDFRMEVVDPIAGSVLVDQSVPLGYRHVSDNLWSSSTADADGFVVFKIWRVALKKK